jgi:hypothetical protein
MFFVNISIDEVCQEDGDKVKKSQYCGQDTEEGKVAFRKTCHQVGHVFG